MNKFWRVVFGISFLAGVVSALVSAWLVASSPGEAFMSWASILGSLGLIGYLGGKMEGIR